MRLHHVQPDTLRPVRSGAGRTLTGPAKAVEQKPLPPERLHRIRERIERGLYHSPAVASLVARRLLQSCSVLGPGGPSESWSRPLFPMFSRAAPPRAGRTHAEFPCSLIAEGVL